MKAQVPTTSISIAEVFITSTLPIVGFLLLVILLV